MHANERTVRDKTRNVHFRAFSGYVHFLLVKPPTIERNIPSVLKRRAVREKSGKRIGELIALYKVFNIKTHFPQKSIFC